ncbi:MAG: ribonuclease Z [Microthrixaceae bacterium]
MISIRLLGTGSPLPSATRAGPSTLVSADGEHFLVDAGRGVLMRLAAAGLGATNLNAVLLTHLHSDHITDIADVICSRWVTSLEPAPLTIVGPPGTQGVLDSIIESLGPDIGYRLAHHKDLDGPPQVTVIEVADGPVELPTAVAITCAPTDHRPVEPSIAFRFDSGGASAVVAGDTVPCDSLDRLCAGAGALVHTVIRKDIIGALPIQRIVDTIDYHSSPGEAGATAQRAGVGTLVLTHYVPEFPEGDNAEWIAQAATEFGGRIEAGDDLHVVEVP